MELIKSLRMSRGVIFRRLGRGTFTLEPVYVTVDLITTKTVSVETIRKKKDWCTLTIQGT